MPSANGQRPLVEALRSSLHLRSLQRWCRSWQSFRSVSSGNKKTRKTETKKNGPAFFGAKDVLKTEKSKSQKYAST